MEDQELRREHAQAWLEKVELDFASARKLAIGEDTLDNAAYHCQQAAEKALKAFIVRYGTKKDEWRNPCNGLDKEALDKLDELLGKKRAKGHDIGCLILQAKKIKPDSHIDSRLSDRGILTTLAIDPRYPRYCNPNYAPVTKTEYNKHYERAQALCKFIIEILES